MTNSVRSFPGSPVLKQIAYFFIERNKNAVKCVDFGVDSHNYLRS